MNQGGDPDNLSFMPDDQFLRRIPPYYYNSATGKVSSAAFQNTSDTNRMSVNFGRLSSVKHTLAGDSQCGVASITAELCWSLEQEIESTPKDTNPAHCDVVGEKPQRIRRKLREKASYLRYPQSVQ